MDEPQKHFPKTAEVIGYVKHHEKLLALVLLLIVGWFGYGKFLDYKERYDQKVYDKDKATLQAQVEQNKIIADANAKRADEYKTLAEQISVQYAQLQQVMAARDIATKKQQQTDRTLPPDALAARWQDLVKLPPLSVQSVTNGTFNITQPAAVETVVMLEEIPKLQGDLKDTQTQLVGAQSQVTKAGEVITGLNVQVAGLNTQIGEEKKTCADSIKVINDKNRKAKRNWFVRGTVAGGAAVLAILKFVH